VSDKPSSSHLLVVVLATRPSLTDDVCAEVMAALRQADFRGIQVSDGLRLDDEAARVAHRDGYIEAIRRYASVFDERAEMNDYHERHGWK
jgi:hypothetical protein